MNIIRYTLPLAVASTLHAAPADDYVNWIRQTQADLPDIGWDVTVAASGQSLSEEGVGPQGSFFQLWSIHNTTAAEYMLDEQYVSSYLPTAKITILTGDPYTSVKRTRVDQPYAVIVTVAGLDEGTSGLSPEEIPEAAKKVAMEHTAVNYDPGTHVPPVDLDAPTVIAQSHVEVNGDTEYFYSVTNLSASDLTQAEGEEVFTVTALEDFGTGPSVLDSQRLQVWPVATGTIEGVNTTTRYADIPNITVNLVDLYPKSETYVRAYLGAPAAVPSEPFLLPASYVKIADSIPQDRELMLRDLNELFEREGPYTVELIHETPFGFDILAQVYPLNVDRTLEIKASLNTGD